MSKEKGLVALADMHGDSGGRSRRHSTSGPIYQRPMATPHSQAVRRCLFSDDEDDEDKAAPLPNPNVQLLSQASTTATPQQPVNDPSRLMKETDDDYIVRRKHASVTAVSASRAACEGSAFLNSPPHAEPFVKPESHMNAAVMRATPSRISDRTCSPTKQRRQLHESGPLSFTTGIRISKHPRPSAPPPVPSPLIPSWPLAILSPDLELSRRVHCCRAPTALHESVQRSRFRLPTIEEVVRRLNEFPGSSRKWIIWELTKSRESLINYAAKDFENQILPYRIPEFGSLPLDSIFGFCSSVLWWLTLDSDNVAMFYEDDGGYLSLLSCLMAAFYSFSHHGVERRAPPLTMVDIGRFFSTHDHPTATPTSVGGCMAAKKEVLRWLAPKSWDASHRRYLDYFVDLMASEEEVLPLEIYELKSVMVKNFIGGLDGLIVEVYHVCAVGMVDGRIRPPSRQEKKDRSKNRNVESLRVDLPHSQSYTSSIPATESYPTPRRHSVAFTEIGGPTRKISCDVTEASLASSRINNSLWDAVDLYALYRKDRKKLSRKNEEYLFTPFGGLRHGHKPRVLRDDSDLIYIPLTDSRKAGEVSSSADADGNSCSATFNFRAPCSRRESLAQRQLETPCTSHDPVHLCGDLLLVIRQTAPQSGTNLGRWKGGFSKPQPVKKQKSREMFQSGFHSLAEKQDACPIVAAASLHTTFLKDEAISLDTLDFEFFRLLDNRLERLPNRKASSNFSVHLFLNKLGTGANSNLRPKADATNSNSHDGPRIQDILRDEYGDNRPPLNNAPDIPVLNLRGLDAKPPLPVDEANARKRGFAGRLRWPGSKRTTRTEADNAVEPPPSEITRAVLRHQESLKISPRPPITARSAARNWIRLGGRHFKPDRPASDSLTTISASWWTQFCDYRQVWQRLPTTVFPSIEEFCQRHAVVFDKNNSLWLSPEYYREVEDLVAFKVCNNKSLEATRFRQEHFDANQDASPFQESLATSEPTSKDESEPPHLVELDSAHKVSRASKREGESLRKNNRHAHKDKGIVSKLKFTGLHLFTFGDDRSPEKSPRATRRRVRRKSGTESAEAVSSSRRQDFSKEPGNWPQEPSNPKSNALKNDVPKNDALKNDAPKNDALKNDASSRVTSSTIWTKELTLTDCESMLSGPKLLKELTTSSVASSSSMRKSLPPPPKARDGMIAEPIVAPKKVARFSMTKQAALTIETSGLLAATPMEVSAPPPMRGSAPPGESKPEAPRMPPMKKAPPPKVGKKAPPVVNDSGGLAGLLGKKAAAAAKNSSINVEKAPLGKRLHWKALADDQVEHTIFAELNRGESHRVEFEVDRMVMDRVFVKEVTKKTGTATKKETNEEATHSIIDGKRAQNMSIVIMRLKYKPEVFANTLLTLKLEEKMTLEDILKIEGIMLTDEEDEALTQYLKSGGPTEKLREMPERRVSELRQSKLPRISFRCKILLFNQRWQAWVEDVTKQLDVLESACNEMRKSSSFRQILSVVLKWGNFVNHGTQTKQDMRTRGITLASLLKLTEFKTTIDATVTSLHYLIANIISAAPESGIHLLAKEMPSVKLAAKITGDGLEVLWKQLNEGCVLVSNEYSNQAASYQPTEDGLDRGYETLGEIKESVGTATASLQLQARRTIKLVLLTARFFGDDSAPPSAAKLIENDAAPLVFLYGSLFVTFNAFLRKFDEAVADIVKRVAIYLNLVPDEQGDSLLKFACTVTGRTIRDPRLAPEATKGLNKVPKTPQREPTPLLKARPATAAKEFTHAWTPPVLPRQPSTNLSRAPTSNASLPPPPIQAPRSVTSPEVSLYGLRAPPKR